MQTNSGKAALNQRIAQHAAPQQNRMQNAHKVGVSKSCRSDRSVYLCSVSDQNDLCQSRDLRLH